MLTLITLLLLLVAGVIIFKVSHYLAAAIFTQVVIKCK
jgi:hypothetical protein